MTNSTFAARWREVMSREHVAVDDGRERVAARELGRRAEAAAATLAAGAPSLAGRRVALLATPGSAWVEAFAGIVLAGGVAVPLSHLYPNAELAYFLDDADADSIVVSADLAARIAPLAGARRLLQVDQLRAGGAPFTSPPLADEDIALMLYTSGTTGKPKGALITHANLATQGALLAEAWGWSADDVLLHALPLHHLHGLGISLLTALLAGAGARMLERFDAHAVWEEMGRATVWMAVPTMYQKLFDAFDAADAATRARWSAGAHALRLATSGSAALPVRFSARWHEIAGNFPLERFGMTEIGVGMTNPLVGTRKPGSVGRPLPTVETRIVDDGGRDVARGATGELWVRGPSVFAGYWRKPDATRDAFGEGWFKTGDMAEQDADGYVRLLGRSSVDILKSGGYKLSALEIEDALREHESVAEVAVIGLPDETWGDLVTAAIVARPGREADLEEAKLRAWAKERIAPYKVPRRIVLLPALPRNAIGKVQKPELKKLLGR